MKNHYDIAIDIRPLQGLHRFRGIGFYIINLVGGLIENKGPAKITLVYDPALTITDKIAEWGRIDGVALASIKDNSQKVIDKILITPDIFVTPRLKGTKNINIFYDLIPYIFRDHYFGRPFLRPDRTYRIHKYKKALQELMNVDKIITISKSSKKDLLEYMPGLQAEKITVAYPGIGALGGIKGSSRAKNSDYILYVGSCDYRKNIPDLIAAHEMVCATGEPTRLVLVGREFLASCPVATKDAISTSKYRELIELPGFVADEDLPALYSNALVFAFPSLYEGFGLPILEAMRFGCPVVSYKNSSLEEVGGEAVLYAANPSGLARQVGSLQKSAALHKELVKKGLRRAEQFTWEKSIIDFMAVIKELSAE